MVQRSQDISGAKFGKLTALYRVGVDSSRRALWHCQCDCGGYAVCASSHLKSGNSASCGCERRENFGRKTHQKSKLREYKVWTCMHRRCRTAKNYAGRGISVCDRWSDFSNFYADMGPRPSARHSIERLDNDGNYEPTNCVWATASQQSRNHRRNVVVCFEGKQMCLTDLAEKFGVRFGAVRWRMNKGWPLDEALGLKPRKASASGAA